MSVQEINIAVSALPPGDLAEFMQWLEQFQTQEQDRQVEEDRRWDEQIAADAWSGRLDALIARAREQVETGQCQPLRLISIVILTLAFCLTQTLGYADPIPATKTAVIHWDSGPGSQQFVKVTLNGKQAAVFMFDSGSTDCSISDAFVKKLRLKQTSIPLSQKDGTATSRVIISSVRIGDLALTNAPFDVVSQEKLKTVAPTIDGILGANVLAAAPSLFDFPQHDITFLQRSPTPDDLKQLGMDDAVAVDAEHAVDTTLPLIDTTLPVFDVQIANGTTVKQAKMCIDTGTNATHVSHALAADLQLKPDMTLPYNATFYGNASVSAAPVTSLSFGGITFNRGHVIYTDAPSAVDGNYMGTDILSHLHVLFDYPNHKIYFKLMPVTP